jgi:hypothetical protein
MPLEPPSAYAPVVMASPDPLTAPLAAVEGPSWPCGACGTANAMAQDTCLACGMHFLAGLRQAEPLLELPVVGDITRLSRAHLLALAFGVVVAFVALTFLLGVVFG